MKIGGVDLEQRVLVVAEIGNNHEGSLDTARELVRQAAAAGADAVKFQTFRADLFVSREDAERFARMSRFELAEPAWAELAELARSHGLLFLSTPLDLASADVLEPLVDAYKIASGDNDFVPLLRRVARSGLPVVVSSGVSGLDTVQRAIDVLRSEWEESGGAGEVAVLHCVSAYPTPLEDVQLRAIPFLADRLGVTVGYSDHTTGIDAAPLAVALGARIVEKHFTLDKAFSDFRDHALSSDPTELADLVRRIRSAEVLLGQPGKAVRPSESGAEVAIRRSVVAGRALPAGHVVAFDDLLWQRPGGGIRPGDEAVVVGHPLVRDVAAGERLAPEDVR